MTATRAFYLAVEERLDALPCRAGNADDWFAQPGSVRSEGAKALCASCPLLDECQEYAIENGIPSGIWGGVDETQREQLWRSWPTGKPSHFVDEMDAALGPLFRERRDFESFDTQNGDPYEMESEKTA